MITKKPKVYKIDSVLTHRKESKMLDVIAAIVLVIVMFSLVVMLGVGE